MSSNVVQLTLFQEQVAYQELRAISIRHAVSMEYLRKLLELLIASGIEMGAALKQMLEAKSHEVLYAWWTRLSA